MYSGDTDEWDQDAYWEGLSAYGDSLDDPENPYDEGTLQYRSWEAGYEQGRNDW
jgi:hypothetical protein